MLREIIHFFDKLEDKTRGTLSHYPFLYAFLGGIGVVLFWRGVWHTNDFILLCHLKNMVHMTGRKCIHCKGAHDEQACPLYRKALALYKVKNLIKSESFEEIK